MLNIFVDEMECDEDMNADVRMIKMSRWHVTENVIQRPDQTFFPSSKIFIQFSYHIAASTTLESHKELYKVVGVVGFREEHFWDQWHCDLSFQSMKYSRYSTKGQ